MVVDAMLMPTLEDTLPEACNLCAENGVDMLKKEIRDGFLYCPVCDRRPITKEKGLTG